MTASALRPSPSPASLDTVCQSSFRNLGLTVLGIVLLFVVGATVGCNTVHDQITNYTGTTLEQRCQVYVGVVEPLASLVAAGFAVSPAEQALVTAFNALNCQKAVH